MRSFASTLALSTLALSTKVLLMAASAGVLSFAQTAPPALPAIAELPKEAAPALRIAREVNGSRPFSVIGPHGALLGQQDGSYEGWIFPWKIFGDMRVVANMQNYPVPIDVNQHAASIEVTPGATTITYSHANFTVRQIMFAPKQSPEGVGVLVLYQIEAIRPMTLTFSFTPAMQRMWPAPSDDHPSPEWVKTQADGKDESGFYILHENFPNEAAAMAMPTAEPGILAPYQERAKSWPLQFVLHFDPATESDTFFPLLIYFANTQRSAGREALAQSLAALDASVASLYEQNATYYRNLLATHTSIETPDANLNAAFSWAIASIDQLRVETPSREEEAFTAGFVGSGDSARPGFGWFFGRDALWTLYAVNSYGDFKATKQELEFLIRHQREDGKIMHEYSQTANLVDWTSLPYEYAAADPTPLLLMAADDYWKISGDSDFIRAHWNALAKAWHFETSHLSDDGIYNNTQGTGWVESWIPSMPYQEIYLAALDEQASTAFADLARNANQNANQNDLASQAAGRAARIRQTIEREYYRADSDFYAFSRNRDGTADATPTIFPAVAWWDGTTALDHPEGMMRRWASSEFSTDWGTRILSDHVSFYDPISYHQGSVWPLFTGWVSLAEYRAGHPLSGYAHLMQNAGQTWSQDLGSITELLSGEFFQPLGRSTAHQLWSSAMVISPLLRGLFGLRWNAASRTLTVTPQIPADWNQATVRRVPLGDKTIDLSFTRDGRNLTVTATGMPGVHLASDAPHSEVQGETLRIPLPAVEVAVAAHLPEFGAETAQMKILEERRTERSLILTLSAPAGTEEKLYARENLPSLQVHAQQGSLGPEQNGLRPVTVQFQPGTGYVTETVTLSW
ncbi:MAG TPA: hypothetical protein VGF96_10595 [Terracidiphilus sp.]|jgi:glycogen debranching enzyme